VQTSAWTSTPRLLNGRSASRTARCLQTSTRCLDSHVLAALVSGDCCLVPTCLLPSSHVVAPVFTGWLPCSHVRNALCSRVLGCHVLTCDSYHLLSSPVLACAIRPLLTCLLTKNTKSVLSKSSRKESRAAARLVIRNEYEGRLTD
jgi:hypothetical protein